MGEAPEQFRARQPPDLKNPYCERFSESLAGLSLFTVAPDWAVLLLIM